MTKVRKTKKYSVGYAILKILVGIAAHIFYRRYTVIGRKHFPAKHPYMLVSNHQNAMMDAIMCCVMAPKQLHFLTRADIFGSKISNKILRHLNMLPVYRPRDGRNKVATLNAITFDESERRLALGNVISAFPEGSHSNKRAIRPLKKGVARIALKSMKKHNIKKMYVLPVGLDYSDYEAFRADLIIRCGEPIDLGAYIEQMAEDETMAINNLTAHISASLRELVIDVRRLKFHDTFITLRSMIVALGKKNESHLKEIILFQEALDKLSDASEENLSKLQSLVEKFILIAGVRGKEMLKSPPKIRALGWLYMVLFSPLILAGLIYHLPPALLVSSTVQKKIKDPHFKSSIKIGMAVFLFPLYWVIVAVLTSSFMPGSYAFMAPLIVFPLCGIFALKALDLFSDLKKTRQIREMEQSEDQELKELKGQINSLLSDLLKK
jgi:1-acyl-sn-glycerol-3-phosphate acyltransferase